VLQYELIGLHPNDNSATILFDPQEIAGLLDKLGVVYRFVS
jgi:hypothetical protein